MVELARIRLFYFDELHYVLVLAGLIGEVVDVLVAVADQVAAVFDRTH